MEKIINDLDFENIFNRVFELERFVSECECSNKSGIYFLFKNDIIVYIGISQSISQRLFTGRTPHKDEKNFNEYAYIEIDKENFFLQKLEFILINFFNPEYNSLNRKQVFLEHLPKEYKDKIERIQKENAYKNAMNFLKYF